MSRKKMRARDKIHVKMSRDGMVEKNLTSGEDSRISKRTVDFDLRGEHSDNEPFSQFDKRFCIFANSSIQAISLTVEI